MKSNKIASYKKHLILTGSSIKQALSMLNELAQDAILFVVDDHDKLIGSITDGDIRRGLLNNFLLENAVDEIIQSNPRFIKKKDYNIQKIIDYREKGFKIIPVLDEQNKLLNIINFRKLKSYLPIDAVIMAGGRGQRMKPLTDITPKPLLKVNDKPIMEYNLNRLAMFGVDDFWISLNHLGDQIEKYFGNGKEKNLNIEYVREKESFGTIGAVSLIQNFKHDLILITNSDLLTNLDYEKFYFEFIKQDADLAVLTVPYQVNIPYAVLETNNGKVESFREKPTYTYFSNGGVYLLKKEMLSFIPKNKFYNATDLMEELIKNNLKVISVPFSGYWLDVGKPEDFEKAQVDVHNIKF
ncbi:nucleotidyltransferase family protein [Flavobacteriaceae bacterium]|nr:nucleotidyltransferase family protein [Flavobacteriaceae bacterium]